MDRCNCDEPINGSNPSIERIAESLEEIKVSLKERYCSFKLRFDSLERKTIIDNGIFPGLSEEMSILENVVKEDVTKNKNLQDMLMESPPLKNVCITELLSTSLSGPRFTGGIELKLHKLLWIFIHIVALFISATYIQDAYYTWQNSVVQSLRDTQVKEIPFPAITICELILLKEEYNQFEELKRCLSFENKTSWMCSEEELNMMLISMDISRLAVGFGNKSDQFFYSKLYNTPTYDYSRELLFQDLNRTYSGMEYLKYVDKLGKACSSRLKIYNGDSSNIHYHSLCNGSISQTIIKAPLKSGRDHIWKCHTFNGVKHGVMKNMDGRKFVSSYGLRKSSNCNHGNKQGNVCKTNLLHTEKYVVIEVEDSDDSPNLRVGAIEFPNHYIVSFHNPLDYPSRANNDYIRAYKYKFMHITLSPKFINASTDLTLIDESKRGCVFSFEKKLSLFEVYTHKNCILECQINCSLTTSGCVPTTLAIFNSSITTCSNNKSAVINPIANFNSWSDFEDNRCPCDCLPDCVSLSYEADRRETYDKFKRTRFMLSYKELEFPSTYRHSLTSPAEFVAYSLGILGTFNGFSVMMVWEILYWLTLRLWFTVKSTLH